MRSVTKKNYAQINVSPICVTKLYIFFDNFIQCTTRISNEKKNTLQPPIVYKFDLEEKQDVTMASLFV